MKIKLRNGKEFTCLGINNGKAAYIDNIGHYKETTEFKVTDSSPVECITIRPYKSKWSRNENQTYYGNNLNNLDETNS